MSKDFEVTLPKLGESIMNATIVQWFKKEGETVKKDEPLLEVATDKVNSEIPSPVSGIVKKIHAKPDQELNVGDPLALISQEEGAVAAPSPTQSSRQIETEENADQKDYYSPALLRLAREHHISFEALEKIPGSGAGGRITKKDLEAYIAKKDKPCPLASSEGVERVKMTPLRKAIAENMVRSFYEAPHASLIAEVDVTDLMRTVKQEKEAFFKKYQAKLSITTFVARALCKVLQEYPLLNASVDKDTILVKKFINLGIAVSVEQGVMVPVIRQCHTLSLQEIAKAIADFATRARTNSLQPDDVKEGTITMTNFGMSGVKMGIPILRYPEVAILGIGAVAKKVVALEDDEFGVRQILNLCLTFDHRVIDGMYGCEFLGAIKKRLESDFRGYM